MRFKRSNITLTVSNFYELFGQTNICQNA